MIDTPFEKIKSFCDKKELEKIYERILFHKFKEDLNALIEDYKETENKDPSDDTLKGFERTLLDENILSTNVRLAKDEIDDVTDKKISKIKRNQNLKDFGISVLSSLVASFLFAVIIIIVFTTAQNQIKTWVNDLYNDQVFIEKQIKQDDISNTNSYKETNNNE